MRYNAFYHVRTHVVYNVALGACSIYHLIRDFDDYWDANSHCFDEKKP